MHYNNSLCSASNIRLWDSSGYIVAFFISTVYPILVGRRYLLHQKRRKPKQQSHT